jgi:hypothetical protein
MAPKDPVRPVQSDSIIGSELNFGKTISDAIYAHTAAKQTSEALAQHSKDVESLVNLYNSQKSKGKDTTHTVRLLNQMLQESATGNVPGGDISDIAPSVNKSAKQIAGEAAGVLTDVLMLTAEMPVAAAGAALGLTHAMQQDKGIGGIAFDTAAYAVGGKILEYGFGKFAPFIGKLAEKYGAPFVEKIAQYIPESAQKAFSNTVSKAVSAGENLAEKATIGTGNKGTEIVQKAAGAVDKAIEAPISAVAKPIKSSYQSITKTFSTNTPEQILATPLEKAHLLSSTERDFLFSNKLNEITQKSEAPKLSIEEVLKTPEESVYKLAPEERKLYYDTKRAEVSGATEEEKAKISADYEKAKKEASDSYDNEVKNLETKKAEADAMAEKSRLESEEKLDSSIKELNRAYEIGARDKVLELRPKVLRAMKEQSDMYGQIVDEQLAPVKDMKVSQQETVDYIKRRYEGDEKKQKELMETLGILDTSGMAPAAKEYPRLTGEAEETTVEGIYRKTKQLRKQISKSSVKGQQSYSDDERKIDDSVSVLTDFLEEKGVDLSKARDFWANYAPVRDKMIKEIQPFTKPAINTEKFAKTLMDVVKGKDVQNENFIAEVEKILGEKVTTEQEALLSKLTQAQKEKLANEAETEAAKQSIKKEAESAKGESASKKESALTQAESAKEQATAMAELQKEKKLGNLSAKEYEARRKSIIDKQASDKAIAEKKAELDRQRLIVEQKAAKRRVIKDFLRSVVGGGIGAKVITHM